MALESANSIKERAKLDIKVEGGAEEYTDSPRRANY